MDKGEIQLKLDQIYNDPSSPAAFSGVQRLLEEARKVIGDHVQRKDVQNYLEGHRTYTLMRPRRVRFKRSKTVAAGFMTDVQVDLADMQALSRHNKGNRYILLAVDVLSKRVFVLPLRTKNSQDMVEGFESLIKQMPMKPHRIFSDKGSEFRNRPLKEFFEQEEIEKFEAETKSIKASLAERAIRTLKQRLYRYFAQKNTQNWIDVLQKIANGINNSRSRVHGMLPMEVNFKNAQKVWKRIYGDELTTKKGRAKYKAGDTVRLSRDKGIFEKGYLPNYGDEIMEIDAVKDHMRPVRYKVRNEKGTKFKGAFYGEEMVPVRKDAATTYRIEKVYKKKAREDGTFDRLVKFIGYPDHYWIHDSEFV